ncbi:hypothetical protein [Pseudonocardia dioxanivorans]|uniref:hypothetical protein n=1 Tax=Pseudonocardia dioxanivorans TaxID=240495 RepID=UPI0005A0113C|nr:hypothetical protein [Pseudonocardia dioxanivorans]
MNFGDALDNKAAGLADDTPGDVPADTTEHVSGDVRGDMSDNVRDDMRPDSAWSMRSQSSGDKLDDVFSAYASARESASLRVRKVSVLMTDAQRDALEQWIGRASKAVPGRVTASDVGMHLFDELVNDPVLTRRVLERLIAGIK